MGVQSSADFRSPTERHIRQMLADGDVRNAIELLTRLLQGQSYDLFRESMLHAARSEEVERQEQLGLLSAADVRVERQRLILSVSEFLGEIRERDIDLGPLPGVREKRIEIVAEHQATPPAVDDTSADVRTETMVIKRDCVFVCYSHADRDWLDRIRRMLQPLIRQNKLDLWDDTRIPVGSTWQVEIHSALSRAAIAVLLVSPNFFASSFILDQELPRILAASSEKQLRVVWVHVSDAMFEDTPIAALQAAHDAGTPLDRLPRPEQQSVLKKICLEIKAAVLDG